jgi:hypothetical protein
MVWGQESRKWGGVVSAKRDRDGVLAPATWGAAQGQEFRSPDGKHLAKRGFLAHHLEQHGVHPNNSGAIDYLSDCLREGGEDENFDWFFVPPGQDAVVLALTMFQNPLSA